MMFFRTENINKNVRFDTCASHLAVPAAEAVAAHGVMGQSALLTAVGSSASALLPVRESLSSLWKYLD